MVKKHTSIIVIIILASVLWNCKGGSGEGLKYSDISTHEWVQANVQNRDSRKGVMWFQLFDQYGNLGAVKSYQNSADKVDKYPASIFADKFVWIMVNNRFEIRLMADEKSPDYQNTEKLKGFLQSFDLEGMEGYAGPRLSGEEMRQFIPKLK